MDAKHAAKAQEAGISPPVSPPDSVIVEDEPKPAVSKKCFCMIVFLVLVGGVVGILTILKREKMEKELALATSTTVAPTTIAISKLKDDDEVLKRCQKKYTAKLGKDSIGLIKTGVNDDSGKELKKGAFWLRGDPVQDQATFKDIKVMACRGQIPTVIISMRPAGYKLILNQDDLNFYDGEPIHEDWESYDERLNVYKKQLLDIPSLVILEPKLLQLTFDEINQQYNYENGIYLDEFLRRAQMMTNALKKSWVYLDAGDPVWLSVDAHLEFASMTLVRLQGLRGFAINTAFYSNSTTVELFARQLSCATNLHYIMDTGRNGGAFSQKSTLEEAAECRFDPPNIKKSNNPGWGFASKKPVDARGRRRRRSAMSRGRRGLYSTDFGVQQQVSRGWSSQGPFLNANVRNTLANAPMDGMPQLKMANGFGAGGNAGLPSRTSSGKIRAIHKAPRGNPGLAGPGPKAPKGSGKSGNGLLDRETAEGIMKSISMKNNRMRCKSKSSKMNYHDAYFWARAPGESDGRLFPAGSVHKCLLNHKLTCDGSCPLITSVPCTCSGAPPIQQQQNWGHQQNWGYQPNYIPQPQPQLNPWNPRTWG
ncbi:Oidioi.mRNA.OKI2018_I69.PAR.g10154.t1.cds [Oikopleura dioica]|uniref:Oidioi.mRNA.OKI2018_I69.PAR.g10154.t1.cds n=1 Tax=Oikopleura dioica TaxID=34765 RepID=A0ABN7RP37_OIKDI|nr:Oidioi.mRNA.OKI2018_I69.PAR.g10154.t1.cds [Oikopleura dioica]